MAANKFLNLIIFTLSLFDITFALSFKQGCSAKRIDQQSRELIDESGKESGADINKIKKLLDECADVNTKMDYAMHNRTALMAAASAGNKDLVQLLLARGADVNAKTLDGRTALADAVFTGNKELMNILLDHKAKADTTVRDWEGDTLIMKTIPGIAARRALSHMKIGTINDYKDIFKQLVGLGVDINAQDYKGNTALMRMLNTAYNSDLEVPPTIEFLIEQGVNPNIKNNENKTALDIAHQKKNLKAIEVLCRHNAEPSRLCTESSKEKTKQELDAFLNAFDEFWRIFMGGGQEKPEDVGQGDYALLGVSENSSDKDIEKAHRRIAIELHPDKHPEWPEASKKATEDKLKLINAAYERIMQQRRSQKTREL